MWVVFRAFAMPHYLGPRGMFLQQGARKMAANVCDDGQVVYAPLLSVKLFQLMVRAILCKVNAENMTS